LKKTALDRDLCAKVRGSILLAGPLPARHGRATLFAPGGDVIGRRRLDTHFEGLDQLGIGMAWKARRSTCAGGGCAAQKSSWTKPA
jgi:UDP-N-acetylglucosamine enolpyruvyl transferase